MPLYDQPQCRRLPEKIVYEARRIQVPSSWRRTYPLASGKKFGDIQEHDYVPLDLYSYPKEWDDAEAGVLHRSFRVPECMAGQRIVLRLDGIMQKAVIYLDRQEIAVWEDGYLPLRLDITSRVEQNAEHHLHIVCGSFDKVLLPNGSRKITALMGSWFGNISRGIWQDVYLEGYPVLTIEDLTIRTSVREGRLEVNAVVGAAQMQPDRGPLRVQLKIREQGVLRQPEAGQAIEEHKARTSGATGSGRAAEPAAAAAWTGCSMQTGIKREEILVLSAEQIAESVHQATADMLRLCENEREGSLYRACFSLDFSDARLWSPDSPFLYLAELELMEGEQVIDRRVQRFGFREFWCDGPQFMLNGIPVNLRGDSWHFQGGAQQTEAYIRNWYRMCRTVGVNSIRLHAEPYPADYVRIADEEGMMIVDETAIYGSGKSMLADHPDYVEACRKHVRRLVQRDRNQPSVVMWSVQNEMRWVDGRDGFKQHIPGFMAAIRELDPTRPLIVEGDNRLLSKEDTEIESRHYNIDGIISQWDRTVPLTFGEHGGWWYICPQNSSMYVGLQAYQGTDESTAGLAQKERLFVEYARRQGVSGISTFNFAHYFMRAIPDRDIVLPPSEPALPGVKPGRIPAYSLSINNGLLPEEYPVYSPNPAFSIMAAAFKPVTMIAAEYNRCFYDDKPIPRSFDVYNDTLSAQEVRAEFVIRQGQRIVHEQSFNFRQEPAGHKVIRLEWLPASVAAGDQAVLTAALFHGGQLVHELQVNYRLMSASLLSTPVAVTRSTTYFGAERDYDIIRRLIPGCERVDSAGIAGLSADHLLVIGSKAEDGDGRLETVLKAFVARGGRLLLLEQTQLSMGKLLLSRRPFFRAHGGDYSHPVLEGLGDEDLMFWNEELCEDGPVPFIHAAFEKPVTGDFTMLLVCSAGDFGDGGDLWSPLLEYRSGRGMLLANQLELMKHAARVPQACLLLRNLLAYAGRAEADGAPAEQRTAALVSPGGEAAAFLGKLRLQYTALDSAPEYTAAPGEAAQAAWQGFGLIVAEACLLEAPGAAEALRRHAEAGGRVLVLPAEERQQAALARLLSRPVRAMPHETYHLAADYANAAVRGISPVDLFGFDKVFLSPRDVVNRVLAAHSLEVQGADALCVSVEGTAWKDYFVHGYTAEYSRLALVELNRRKARPAGIFLTEVKTGAGSVLCSQLLIDTGRDKALRLYTRLLGNLGASFDDGLLDSEKGDAEWAVEMVMALPCPPHVDYGAMKDYYIDPEFSLNNLGEGLYGWMQKKERRPGDGTLLIEGAGQNPWFICCFVQVPEEAGAIRQHRKGRLRIDCGVPLEIYINGGHVAEPEQELVLQSGLNRFIAMGRGTGGDLAFRMVFLNADGTYMKDLAYQLTLDEVEPK